MTAKLRIWTGTAVRDACGHVSSKGLVHGTKLTEESPIALQCRPPLRVDSLLGSINSLAFHETHCREEDAEQGWREHKLIEADSGRDDCQGVTVQLHDWSSVDLTVLTCCRGAQANGLEHLREPINQSPREIEVTREREHLCCQEY